MFAFVLGKTKFKGVEGRKAKILDRNDQSHPNERDFDKIDMDKDGESQN